MATPALELDRVTKRFGTTLAVREASYAVQRGENVLLVDDLIATGGTAEAAIRLIEKVGGNVVGCSFIIDLPELKGRERLEKLGKQVLSLVEFEGH